MQLEQLVGRQKWELLDGVSRWILALVFLSAGVPKLLGLSDFAEVIGAYGLVPDSLLLPTAVFLSVLEIAGAVGLIFRKEWALYVISALLVLFILVLFYGLRLGLDVECGCFAQDAAEYHHFSGLRAALLRDFLLAVPVMYLILGPTIRNYCNKGMFQWKK